MTNGEHYKTVKERTIAFRKFCTNKICKGKGANCIFSDKMHDDWAHKCEFAWLAMEYKPKPMPCPFCGCAEIELRIGSHASGIYSVCSRCGCRTDELKNETDAIESWNRRAK